MTIKAKPMNESGEKNVFCPNYSRCLDHASKNYWDFWSCTQCASQNLYVAPQAMQSLVSARNDGTDFMVSPVMARHTVNTWLNS